LFFFEGGIVACCVLGCCVCSNATRRRPPAVAFQQPQIHIAPQANYQVQPQAPMMMPARGIAPQQNQNLQVQTQPPQENSAGFLVTIKNINYNFTNFSKYATANVIGWS
jgi:hypothetical protein